MPWVFIDAQPIAVPMWSGWEAEPNPAGAYVELAEGESIERADLRFVVGLTVWVDAFDAERKRALWDACIAHGAARVVCMDETGLQDSTEAAAWQA